MAERTMPARDDAEPDSPSTDGLELIHRPDPLTVTTPAEYAQALATLREQAGLSLRDLARTVGSTSSALGDWCSGRHLPPVSATPTVEKMIAACGVPAGPARTAWIDALNRVRRLPEAPLADAAPYRGLESYRVDDAAFFFGREKLVARLVALVTSSATAGPTVLVGPSGSGKSSALQAGLVARLKAAGTWEIATITPGPRPLEALETALTGLRGSLRGSATTGARVAVLVDQLEELFTLGSDEDTRAAFLRKVCEPLRTGADGAGRAVTVVLALRADFYGAALRHEPLSQALQDRQVVIGPMTEAELRRAVVEPARAAGAQIDPGLVELVLHDTPATALPLMSFALLETWWHGQQGRLTVEDYVAAGGISAAVSTAAEKVHAGLSPEQRELARRLFGQLVAVDDTAPDTRRRATAADLGLDRPEGDALSAVLERFVAARLLTTTETTVEIAHEAVLTAWPRLRTWLDAERAGLVTRRRLAEAALAWERDGRDARALHRGAALVTARSWAAEQTRPDMLTPAEQAFLDASAAAYDREQAAASRRTHRMRMLLAVVTAIAVLATAVSAVALVQRSSAAAGRDQALSRQLAEVANRLRRTDPTAAAQVAVLGWRTSPTVEARSALLDTSAAPLARRVDGPGGPASAAVSGNGRVLAAVGDQGGLRVWTLDGRADPTPAEAVSLPRAEGAQGKALYAVALNREGTVVAVGGASGVLHAWDLRSPGRPVPLPSAPLSKSAVLALAFSADGRTLAVGLGDGRVSLWNVQPGRGAATLVALGTVAGPVTGQPVQAVALSADGRALAAAGAGRRIQLWTLADRAHPQAVPVRLAGPAGSVTSLAFTPDGHRLVAGSKDQKAYLWALATPTAAPRLLDGAGSWVNTVATSPDNNYVAVGGTDHHLRVYETASRTLVADLPHPGPVTTAAYLADGRTLATGDTDGVVRLWPVPGPTATMPTARTFGAAYLGHDRLATTTSKNALRIFDVSQAHRPRPLGAAISAPPGARGGSGSAGFSGTLAVDRAGTLLAAGGTDGSVWLYRVGINPGTPLRLLATLPRTQRQLIESAALTPDGKTLVTGSDDGTLAVFDVSDPAAPQLLGPPLTGEGIGYALAFRPDGKILAVGTGTPAAVTLYDLSDRTRPRRLGQPISGPTMTVYSVAFAPDGKTLAVGSADRTVRLLDTGSPARARWLGPALLGAGDYVNSVAYSPDGRTVAAAGSDGVLRLWDVSDRDAPVALAALTAAGDQALYAVAFDRTPGRVAAAGIAPILWQWDLDPDAVATRVCTLTGSPLSHREWSRYLPSLPYRPTCRS